MSPALILVLILATQRQATPQGAPPTPPPPPAAPRSVRDLGAREYAQAGLAGAGVGATIGSAGGPAGTAVGAVVGGLVGLGAAYWDDEG